MIKTTKVTEGVVSEYGGKYWGRQLWDNMDFGNIEHAKISDSEFCKKPTDMTHDPRNTLGFNTHYNKLLKAKLVKVKRVVTTEFTLLK